MYPDQQNQPGQNGYRPAPMQQNSSGHYEVVPPVNNTPGASGHNPYEFIVSPNNGKHGMYGGGGFVFNKQMLIIVGGLVTLLLVLGSAFVLFKPKSNLPGLVAVAQRQQEIIRISSDATKKTSTQDASNFVTGTQLAMITSQQKMLTYLAAHDIKPKPKTLALDADPKTDALLVSAASANNYDTTVVQVLRDELVTYEKLLQTSYKEAKTNTAKQALKDCFGTADALVKQAQDLQPADS
jgi:hypothetical protein